MTLSRRQHRFPRPDALNHHIYLNDRYLGRRVYWVNYTVYPTPVTKMRIRHSLKTTSIAEARRKRDAIFASFT